MADNLNKIIEQANIYHDACLNKISFIKELPGGKWRVTSKKGKNLGTFDSKEEAKKRLQQVEYFKWKGKKKKASKDEIDLTDIHDLSYSAIMRDLRKQCDQEIVTDFLTTYKNCFDRLVEHEVPNPANLSLLLTLKLFRMTHPVKLNLKKEATISELGEASRVGRYLADIIRFTLGRISPENRSKSLASVVRKIYLLNENDLANKEMPPSSSIGQAITFVKQVLLAHDPRYIREVINNIVAYLR